MPQYFVDVDRDKVLSQGVDLGQVYGTLQAFMGGQFVNYFNRFGRQWQVYVEAEGDYRTDVRQLGQFYVRNSNGDPVPLAAVTKVEKRAGPRVHHALQPLPLGADQRHRLARLQLGPGDEGAGGGLPQTMPAEMGFDYLGMSFQEKKAQEGVPPAAVFALSLLVRLPDPGRALRELVAAVQRPPLHPHRRLRRVCGPSAPLDGSSTSTPRSASSS